MAQTIVDNRMRYAKKSPEEQKSAKLSQVACLNEDKCSSGTDANAIYQVEPTRSAWAKTGQT